MNSYDIGMQQDYDNMTKDLGTTIIVYPYTYDVNYEGQEDTTTALGTGVTETAFIQELETKHEVVASGQMNVGDIRITFKSNSIVSEECQVLWNASYYKVLNLSKVRGMNNDKIVYIQANGKKLPQR